MAAASQVVAHSDVAEAYFTRQAELSLLRFITCGSVDDGKSTLIGRLLVETKNILDDQIDAVVRDSQRHGTQGQETDLALLVDGLAAEREQGITIDVAYRFFSTDRRKFIVADTPGHEQYTRNMATGASTAELAIILVDARHGLVTQTLRHSHIVSLMRTPHILVAVNKMDLVDYSRSVFDTIEMEYRRFAEGLGSFRSIRAIPISALSGANVTSPSSAMPWYDGPTLLAHLEQVETTIPSAQPLRFPVQHVARPNSDFRGYAGQIAAGAVSQGDAVRIVPSGLEARVSAIVLGSQELASAQTGRSVTLCLDREIDVSRGDVICAAESPAATGDQFEASVLWMNEEPLLPGRRYLLKCATSSVPASVTRIKYRTNVATFAQLAANHLALNELGVCNLSLDRVIAFDPFVDIKPMGSFILIDLATNATVGLGMLRFPLRRAANIHAQSMRIDRQARAQLKGHGSAVLWFTGLSGSGKSTIADIVEQRLADRRVHTMVLDGDNVRHGLNRDLGFTDADRVENVRRIAEVSRLFFEAGVVTIVAFISPFRSERALARGAIERAGGKGRFVEIHVHAPLEVAEKRDVKGLYAKARAGTIANFTGIDSAYEVPVEPELVLDTTAMSAEEAATIVIEHLDRHGLP